MIPWTSPTRAEQLGRLQKEDFDVLVIGGGCVGAGVMWEAATRGLKVAMVERDDFASGTSGRSTKLIHGGIRYLESAFFNLDAEMLGLVKEALHEARGGEELWGGGDAGPFHIVPCLPACLLPARCSARTCSTRHPS